MKIEGEYFTIREGIATYLCRRKAEGCEILAQLGVSRQWIKFRNPQSWKWLSPDEQFPEDVSNYQFLSREPEQPTPISKEKVTAILLMGKNETL